MKESTEKRKKQVDQDETDVHYHCPILLTICDSILQAFIAILRFLGFNHNGPPHRPGTSSPEDCYTAGSNPPSTTVDSPDDESEEEREYHRPNVPRPPWSSGGGGQTD